MLELGGDERLVILLGDLSHFLLRDFEAKYKARFFNLGIAEQSMVSISAGLAMNGFFPVVHSIVPFITERCLEQIKDDLCYQKLGVNLVSIGSAFDYAALGCTHHSYGDVAILRALPGMQVVCPGSNKEFDLLFKEAYANGSPTYFRITGHGIETNPQFGEVEKIKTGSVVTVAVLGPQLTNALPAVLLAEEQNIACDLLYFTTVKPLSDKSKKVIKDSLFKTKRLVTIEEHSVIGGLADEIGLVCKDMPHIQERIGIQDRFLTNYGTYEEHCKENGLTTENIFQKINEIIKRNPA